MTWSRRRLDYLRFLLGNGLSQAEIARKMNTSQQVVSYQKNKLRRKYYENRG